MTKTSSRFKQPFSPEFQLACACCRVQATPSDWNNIRHLLPQVDVARLLELVVTRHRIAPLVHAKLRQLPADALPQGLMAPLAAEVRHNALKAMRAVRSHVLLDRWFKAAGIVWMPFKGSTVAQRYYSDVSLRQVNDIDIWVPETQLDAVRQVLAAQGFQWDRTLDCWDLADRGPNHAHFLSRYYFEENQYSAQHGSIDLHWRLTGNAHTFRLDPQQLLNAGDKLQVGEAQLRVMNSVDLLLYLCEHGGRHGWYRLKWLADLPQLLESTVWDWDDVLARARQAGCLATLLLGLSLAIELFAWDAPAVVRHAIDQHRWLRWQGAVVGVCLRAPAQWWRDYDSIPVAWQLRLIAYRTLLFGNWRAWLSQCRRLCLSPKDLRELQIPDRYFFLYYLTRPWLLLRRKGRLASHQDTGLDQKL